MEQEPQGDQTQGVEENAELSPEAQQVQAEVLAAKTKVSPEDWKKIMLRAQDISQGPGNWQEHEQDK